MDTWREPLTVFEQVRRVDRMAGDPVPIGGMAPGLFAEGGLHPRRLCMTPRKMAATTCAFAE